MDLLEGLGRTARRRVWTFAALVGGVMGGIIVIAAFVSPPGPSEVGPFLAGTGALLVVVIGLPTLTSYANVRAVRRLRPIAPHLAEVGRPWGRGITLVLRNGVVVTVAVPTTVITCDMFFAANRAVLHPSLREAVHWTRPWSMTRLGAVTRASGPLDAREELDAIRKDFRALTSVCVVGRWKVPTPSSTEPSWVVRAAFVAMFPIPLRIGQLEPKLAAIERLMLGTIAFFVPAARARKVRADRGDP